MRNAFISELGLLAAEDPRVMFITGDLGFSVIEDFEKRFPSQFLNAGVAEQNMTGMAAGLASCGRVVFTYSIGNFPTLRALEQIRNDICYHNLDVKIVTIGGGLAYGALGYSHHAIEDLAIMRALPNMTVVAPGDPAEAGAATRALVETPGPAYLRLGKAGEPKVHVHDIAFQLGRAIEVRAGTDVTLISIGGMLATAVEVAASLEKAAISASVLSMHTLKPIDASAILTAASDTGRIVTIEEHSLAGGLGGAVAEVLADGGCQARLKRIGLPSECTYTVGSQDYLRAHYGLKTDAIVETVMTFMDESRPSDRPTTAESMSFDEGGSRPSLAR